MLSKNDEIMLEKIRNILDEIHKEYSKIYGRRRKTDGNIALYVEYGSSVKRFVEPKIRIEIISYTLAVDSREKLFIFDSIQEAYNQVEEWYLVRREELKQMSLEDRTAMAAKVDSGEFDSKVSE